MAKVTLKLFAALRGYIGGAPSLEVDITPGQTVGDLLDRLGVPREQARIFFVNNRSRDAGYILHGGEEVGVFPAIGGG